MWRLVRELFIRNIVINCDNGLEWSLGGIYRVVSEIFWEELGAGMGKWESVRRSFNIIRFPEEGLGEGWSPGLWRSFHNL